MQLLKIISSNTKNIYLFYLDILSFFTERNLFKMNYFLSKKNYTMLYYRRVQSLLK
jgi:hypothetical protein